MKRKKLRKLIRQEICAVLAELATPPEGLAGGLLGGTIGRLFGKGDNPSTARPIYPSDASMNQALSALLNITKESLCRGEDGTLLRTRGFSIEEEPNVSC